jgi:hypothetical protein
MAHLIPDHLLEQLTHLRLLKERGQKILGGVFSLVGSLPTVHGHGVATSVAELCCWCIAGLAHSALDGLLPGTFALPDSVRLQDCVIGVPRDEVRVDGVGSAVRQPAKEHVGLRVVEETRPDEMCVS